MPLFVANHRTSQRALHERYGAAVALDVTSKGPQPWVRFSPFYPHLGIPVPFSPGVTSATVEGIWQGLKVFEAADVDVGRFAIADMRGIKRSARSLGRVLGHRAGVAGERLLPYVEARRLIYLPAYRWVLEQRAQAVVEELRRLAAAQVVVLLDYETNGDVTDVSRPLSHAWLIKHFIEATWPTEERSAGDEGYVEAMTMDDAGEQRSTSGADGDVIMFYGTRDAYGCFSNFARYPITLRGKVWPTTEHYFQAQKFAGTAYEGAILHAASTTIAARMGRSRDYPLRADWEAVKDSIMLDALRAKFTQHADAREMLLGTGDAQLVEHTSNDRYWADGGDGSGKNMLGVLLMRVREELRAKK